MTDKRRGEFERQRVENIRGLGAAHDIRESAHHFMQQTAPFKYTYNFDWLGRPIIQLPQDIVAIQEIIWRIRPDLIVETGIAHGGSLILSASILELLGGEGRVVGVDIEIRPHNRREIEGHPLAGRITMIEGSSTDPRIAEQVYDLASSAQVMIILDSDHTHDHVLQELELYSPLVGLGGYVLVFDTVIEDMPVDAFPGRPWGRGDNPKTAVHEFLSKNDRFEIDREIENKLLITVAPDGYLRCIADLTS